MAAAAPAPSTTAPEVSKSPKSYLAVTSVYVNDELVYPGEILTEQQLKSKLDIFLKYKSIELCQPAQ